MPNLGHRPCSCTVCCYQGRPKHNHNHNFPRKFCIWCHTKTAFVMAHQMKNICGFSVFHCVEGHLVRHPGVSQKRKMGPREMNSKMVVVMVGPSLMLGNSLSCSYTPSLDPRKVWEGLCQSSRVCKNKSPKGPFRTKNAIAMEIVVFCYRGSILLSYRFAAIFPRKTASKLLSR